MEKLVKALHNPADSWDGGVGCAEEEGEPMDQSESDQIYMECAERLRSILDQGAVGEEQELSVLSATKRAFVELRDEQGVLHYDNEALSSMASVVMSSFWCNDSFDKFRETFQWLKDHNWMKISYNEKDLSFMFGYLRKAYNLA